MWSKRHWCYVLVLSLAYKANSITNSNFNAHIREYSVIDHDILNTSNTTNIKTLQKDIGSYASYAPANSPQNYKEVPDSALSSSSHGRGLHHEHPGYVISDYEDIPHYGHGYEYHIQEPHDYKYYDHYNGHPYSGHHINHGHGHHHKHYEHALAAKTLLWPIAGIALLGAAAALVSNPVLLQLGVVSGRRRRQVDAISSPDYIPDLEKIPQVMGIREKLKNYNDQDQFKKRMAQWNVFREIKHQTPKTILQKSVKYKDINSKFYNTDDFDDRFIPIPIKIRSN